jgi:hypothetical protein
MSTVTLRSPAPYQSFATRQGDATSDADRLIYDVDPTSQLFRDLLGSGCAVYEPPASSGSTSQGE